MFQSSLPCRCLLFVFLHEIYLTSSQNCTNDIADFFYNVSFAGPLFNQTVYTASQGFSVATPINTRVFTFTVISRTNYDRPSYISTNVNSRILKNPSTNINVTSSDASFTVQKLAAPDTYELVTATSSLSYFRPFNRYLFQLIAKENYSDRPAAISTARVQIDLKNDNVHRPIFVSDKQEFYISETTPDGTQFGTVYATDADNDPIIYSTNSAGVSIEPHTGVLRLGPRFQRTPWIGYENVTIMIKDSPADPANDGHTTSAVIKILITAVNQYSPEFRSTLCGTSIKFDENHSIEKEIESIFVSDKDRGENGQINISFPSEQLRTTVSGLRNTAYSQFYIEQLDQTGDTRQALLKANETFDYDLPGATRVWHLFILATDNGKPQRQALCSLRINLVDVNDNAPKFIMTSWNYTIYRSAFSRNNTRLLRIIAFDADSGLNGMINYYIGTSYVPYFAINRQTGYITLRSDISGIQSLNVSRFPITFSVYAQDSGLSPLISSNNATVTIYYRDNDDLPPAQWLDTSYEELNISISEKFYETHRDRTIRDGNFNGSIIYSLSSDSSSIMTVYSPYSDKTQIPFHDIPAIKNGRTHRSGITVTSGLHAEIQELYLLYIRVLANPPLIGSVTINLIDENDQIPTFDIRSIVLSVVEKEQGKRTIAQIQAFDRDILPKNNYIEYRLNQHLSDKEANETFHVESDGTVWTDTIFGEGDRNKTSYRLFITAYNIIPAWDNATNHTEDFQIDVQVISINENPPVFQIDGSMKNISIDATTANGTIILNLTIIDKDIDTNLNLGILSGNSLNAFMFTLLSDNSNDLTRTHYEAIGELKVVAPLDYTLKSNYTLVLFAFDTKNTAHITVDVQLKSQNIKAPYFKLMPGFTTYKYQVTENEIYPVLQGSPIEAIDPDDPPTLLRYEIYDVNHQLNLNDIFLNQSNNYVTIGIKPPGLSRDVPFGSHAYNFSIRATDQNGTGVSSYAPVSIEVIDINNNAPIPWNSSWSISEGMNSKISITFKDYDDPMQNNTTPYTVKVVGPSNVQLVSPTVSSNEEFTFVYMGVLNCTTTKYLNITFNATDNKGLSAITTIPITVRGQPNNTYPIYNGYKTINVIYVDGYQNSLRNINLGSIYVNDTNDCVRDNRHYLVVSASDGTNFTASQGFLQTSGVLNPGLLTIHVNVSKLDLKPALSTIKLEVESIDSEHVREASTIRIQGEQPKTLIDSTLGYPLNRLRRALSSILGVPVHSIKILSLRSVFQYRSPYYPPKPLEVDKAESLTDVIFHVSRWTKFQVEDRLANNLGDFERSFQIKANASGPNPCANYACPRNTTCRPTRTIGLKPSTIDTNEESFVGINILDSADCLNSIDTVHSSNTLNACQIATFNNLSYCSNDSLSSMYGPIGPCCEILGRTFDANGKGYARFAGRTLSSIPPARFSFDFVLQSLISNGLILLHGRNSTNINDFFWIAVDIHQSNLRFHFRDRILSANDTKLNASIWYHVEYQFLDSIVLVSVNDCQYNQSINTTLNTDDLSTVELYLGSLPSNSIVSHLYPSLTSIDGFNGNIRNVLSNGYYLDMSKTLSSAYSDPGEGSCLITNSCPAAKVLSDMIVPWYTWLIIALVSLLLVTVLAMALLTLIRQKQRLKTLGGLYPDDTKDNIIDYKETAGEEDHSAYNLRILKKPRYALTDGSTILHDDRLNNTNPKISRRPSMGGYIEEKLNGQFISHAYDTQLRYQYEGAASIASDLSSLESFSSPEEINYRYLASLGPKFSRLADFYADAEHSDDI